ncbi:MAG: hypothetical protein WC757_00420 [Candidatus Paceibacterota bacterium]|jgi:hypothetical protein
MQDITHNQVPKLSACDIKYAQDDKIAPGSVLINVSAPAHKAYGFTLPVLVTTSAYKRCVELAKTNNINHKRHNVKRRLLKLLALAKLAIQQAPPHTTVTSFKVPLDNRKLHPTLVTMRAVTTLDDGHSPVLLLMLANEPTAIGNAMAMMEGIDG